MEYYTNVNEKTSDDNIFVAYARMVKFSFNINRELLAF